MDFHNHYSDHMIHRIEPLKESEERCLGIYLKKVRQQTTERKPQPGQIEAEECEAWERKTRERPVEMCAGGD